MRWLPDRIRAHGLEYGAAAILLLLVGLRVAPHVYRLADPPLVAFHDGSSRVEVWAEDDCLQARYGGVGSKPERTVRYCAWVRADGTDLWVPRVKELLVLSGDRRLATELVVFGLLPDEAAEVRFTLLGGHEVRLPARRHDELSHPAFWLHLRKVALPVDPDLAGGEAVFAHLQVFDAAGRELPVV